MTNNMQPCKISPSVHQKRQTSQNCCHVNIMRLYIQTQLLRYFRKQLHHGKWLTSVPRKGATLTSPPTWYNGPSTYACFRWLNISPWRRMGNVEKALRFLPTLHAASGRRYCWVRQPLVQDPAPASPRWRHWSGCLGNDSACVKIRKRVYLWK
jgi:hypothetical protein